MTKERWGCSWGLMFRVHSSREDKAAMELPDKALSAPAVPTMGGARQALAAPAAAPALAANIPPHSATIDVAPNAPAPHATFPFDAWGASDAWDSTPPLPPNATSTPPAA